MAKGVLLVRAEKENSPLELALRERGFNVFSHSLVNIECTHIDDLALDNLVQDHYDGIIIVSPNTVRCLSKQLKGRAWPKANKHYFTVGPGTAKSLSEAVSSPVTWPIQGHDSESLLALSDLQDVSGQHWLIVTGKNGRKHIEDTLKGRGARVTVAEVYERIAKTEGEEKIPTAYHQDVQRIVITSREQASLLYATLNEQSAQDWARGCHWVLPSGRVFEPLQGLDIPTKHIHFASSAIVEDLVATITSIKRATENNKLDSSSEDDALDTMNKEDTTAPTSPTKGRFWTVLLFIVLFLCIATLSAGGWWLWQQQSAIEAKNQEEIAQVRNTLTEAQRRDANFEARLEARLQDQVGNDIDQIASEQASKFTRLEEMQEAQSRRIREQMAQQDRELARLSQRLRETEARNSHQWIAHEAYDRVTSATQRLAIDNNPDTAIQLLLQAHELLSENTHRFQSIIMQLERDIEYLQNLPRIDLSGTLVTLQTLQQEIPRLPLRSQSVEGSEETESESSSDISDWRSNLANAWEAFSQDLIRVQKTSELPVRLDQEQRLSLNSRLEMQLQLAQQAAVRGDQSLFDASIEESFRLIDSYFDTQVPETQNTLSVLSSLGEVTVTANYPNSLLSRAMLREYISALESAPVRVEE